MHSFYEKCRACLYLLHIGIFVSAKLLHQNNKKNGQCTSNKYIAYVWKKRRVWNHFQVQRSGDGSNNDMIEVYPLLCILPTQCYFLCSIHFFCFASSTTAYHKICYKFPLHIKYNIINPRQCGIDTHVSNIHCRVAKDWRTCYEAHRRECVLSNERYSLCLVGWACCEIHVKVIHTT